jgi:hypothetical protein
LVEVSELGTPTLIMINKITKSVNTPKRMN